MPKRDRKGVGWLFHPYEFAFCGHSGSGKTTLIINLIETLSKEYRIGFVKHDVHGFEIDHEGKDTHRARSRGASSILINNPRQFAEIHANPLSSIQQKTNLLNNDIVLVEGYKSSPIPKFLFIDKNKRMLKEFQENNWENVLGFIGFGNSGIEESIGYPYFGRDDVDGIQNSIVEKVREKINDTHLYGLVLTGGKSTRLKSDKCELDYHGVSQAEYCYRNLQNLCTRVFISNRREQAPNRKAFPQIHDQFLDFGPLGGILTAMVQHPAAAWLVLGCDLPFVDMDMLARLTEERAPLKMATAYTHNNDGIPEPLCTIYEPKIRPLLFQCLGLGYSYPLKALENCDIKTVIPDDGNKLRNVNTPEEFEKAYHVLKKRGSV
jgi:molybdopterin-guanine dinucleotide biosynthesis protein MobB